MLGSFPDVCVANVGLSIAFYTSLLPLDVIVDHGWYAELGVQGETLLALVTWGHETVPVSTHALPRGVIVSFEVDDAAAAYAEATRLDCVLLVDLVSELGQRHFMVADPDGVVVDVIERIALTTADMRRLARYRRQAIGSAPCS